MLYRIGADLVLLAHFLFVAFAVFGGVLAFYSPAWPWVHVPVVLWASVVNLMSWTCPLTPAEKFLRNRAGQLEYSGGFVEHYIGRLVYPRGMPRQLELVAGVSIVVWNALVYAVVLSLTTR
ncbi:MAG TPA: DUF2784 domain-containing protein [Burkholderiales bacterium]|jgi:uncharacterized protein DUF2784|nr:DUF2784 domain-containing protein [Burkholderiales bacterium]